jgi:hypothetical protein
VEKQTEVLKRVASAYGAESAEAAALRLAALALVFTTMNSAREFSAFLKEHGDELTARQRKDLSAMGLE